MGRDGLGVMECFVSLLCDKLNIMKARNFELKFDEFQRFFMSDLPQTRTFSFNSFIENLFLTPISNLLMIRSLSLVNRSSSSLRKRNASDTSRRNAKQNPHSEAPAILVRRLNEAASAICHWRRSWSGCYKSNMADFTKTILTVLMQLSPPFSKLVTWTGLIKCSEKRAEFEMSS